MDPKKNNNIDIILNQTSDQNNDIQFESPITLSNNIDSENVKESDEPIKIDDEPVKIDDEPVKIYACSWKITRISRPIQNIDDFTAVYGFL